MGNSKWGIAIFLMLCVVGMIRIVYKIIKINIRKTYTKKYLKTYINWLKKGDSDEKLYIWLTQNIGRIQLELGQTGVAVNYISPGSIYAKLSNYCKHFTDN